MRERYCRVCGGWHDIEAWPHNCMPEVAGAPSDLSMPFIASDAMSPVQSMLDGQMYDSKSKLRATYKAAGVVEVGNDPIRFRRKPKAKPDRKAIKTSIEKAEARFNRGERVSKA